MLTIAMINPRIARSSPVGSEGVSRDGARELLSSDRISLGMAHQPYPSLADNNRRLAAP
jgi:hypothetical protein